LNIITVPPTSLEYIAAVLAAGVPGTVPSANEMKLLPLAQVVVWPK